MSMELSLGVGRSGWQSGCSRVERKRLEEKSRRSLSWAKTGSEVGKQSCLGSTWDLESQNQRWACACPEMQGWTGGSEVCKDQSGSDQRDRWDDCSHRHLGGKPDAGKFSKFSQHYLHCQQMPTKPAGEHLIPVSHCFPCSYMQQDPMTTSELVNWRDWKSADIMEMPEQCQ